MARKKKDFDDDIDFDEVGGYVPVTFASSLEEAENLCRFLEDHDIPAMIDEDREFTGDELDELDDLAPGEIPVLVPRSFLSEAEACLAEREEAGLIHDEDFEEEEDEEILPDEDFDIEDEDEEF